MICEPCHGCFSPSAPVRDTDTARCAPAVEAMPAISIEGGLDGFSIMLQGQSAVQGFRVAVSGWQRKVVAAAPLGFGVSFTPGGPYRRTATLPKTPGASALPERKVYVRFLPTDNRAYNGKLYIETAGAITRAVPVTGVLI